MHKHLRHLRTLDKRLKPIIDQTKLADLPRVSNYFAFLVESIISQQLSVKASDTIFARFKKLYGKKKFPTPQDVLATSIVKLRSVGLSGAKAIYLKDLAVKVLDKTLDFKKIDSWDDEKIIEHLCLVKGIGRWTAEMFLMFALQREDIFSYGDQGLKNAMQKIYKLKERPSLAKAEKISSQWKPYRSYAARYLWASLNNT